MTRKKSLRRRDHGTRNALVLVSLLVAAIVAIAYVAVQGGGSQTGLLGAGAKAPTFTLTGVNGSSFSLANYVGKSDVLLFFNEGLTCSPCLQQMVEIDKNYSTFRQMGMVVVSITGDSSSGLTTWARNNGISNMMVLPDPTLAVDRQYTTLDAGSMHAGSAPGHTFILIDKDGTVVWRKDYGPNIMYVPMTELVASLKSAVG